MKSDLKITVRADLDAMAHDLIEAAVRLKPELAYSEMQRERDEARQTIAGLREEIERLKTPRPVGRDTRRDAHAALDAIGAARNSSTADPMYVALTVAERIKEYAAWAEGRIENLEAGAKRDRALIDSLESALRKANAELFIERTRGIAVTFGSDPDAGHLGTSQTARAWWRRS